MCALVYFSCFFIVVCICFCVVFFFFILLSVTLYFFRCVFCCLCLLCCFFSSFCSLSSRHICSFVISPRLRTIFFACHGICPWCHTPSIGVLLFYACLAAIAAALFEACRAIWRASKNGSLAVYSSTFCASSGAPLLRMLFRPQAVVSIFFFFHCLCEVEEYFVEDGTFFFFFLHLLCIF